MEFKPVKYIIITLVITAILAILAYILDLTNDKSDKYFLTAIGILLILSGLFFTIKLEKHKDIESTNQTVKIDTTLVNTEKLKLKADSIIINLNESLEKTLSLSNNINKQNQTLSEVETDIKKQIKTLNKTLKQTEIFQRMVDEQNKREITQFNMDSAKIKIFTNDIKFVSTHNDSNYNLKFLIKNSGKRTANKVKVLFNLLLFEENKNSFLMDNSLDYDSNLNPVLGTNSNKDYAGFVQLRKTFSLDELKNKFKFAYLVIRINYEDESNKKPIEENFFFLWNGYNENELTFVNLPPKNTLEFIEILKKSQFSHLLINHN